MLQAQICGECENFIQDPDCSFAGRCKAYNKPWRSAIGACNCPHLKPKEGFTKMAQKPGKMSVADYNKLMMDDALQMLKNALVEVRELRSLVNDMQTAAQNAEEDITEAQEKFEQMRLKV